MNAGEVEALIANLADVDDRLRALYRALADDPDLAEKHDAEIRDLRGERRTLAERVGLAVLAQRRQPRAERHEESRREPEAVTLHRARTAASTKRQSRSPSSAPR